MKNIIKIILLLNLGICTNLLAQNSCKTTPIEYDLTVKNIPTPDPAGSGPPPPPPPPPGEQERVVGFLHGISGGSHTWVTARNWTDAKYENAVTPSDLTYDMTNLADASYRIQEKMDEANNNLRENLGGEYDATRSFIVAHSLGGLVSRDMEYRTMFDPGSEWENPQFGGLITFGTPHQGTLLVNNLRLASQMAREGCHLASQALVAEFIENNFSNFGILSKLMKNFLYSVTLKDEDDLSAQGVSVENLVCETILGTGINFVLSGMLPSIANDMSPDSEALDKLNKHEFQYPLIACYGNEDDPVSLRQIRATQTDIDAFAFGEADLTFEEDAFIETYNDYVAGLEALYIYYSNLSDPGSGLAGNVANGAAVGGLIGTLIPFLGTGIGTLVGGFIGGLFGSNSTPDYASVALAYAAYWQWALNFDVNYRIIMGLDDVNSWLTGYETVCECTAEGVPIGILDCATEELPNEAGVECEEVFAPVYQVKIDRFENDGTVRASSASQVPHAGLFVDFDMPGSNHVQMKNDSNIKEILTAVFAGISPVTNFFKLSI